jgi:integrase
MATIRPRRRRDGSIGYTATIRIKKEGRLLHQESQTFSREALASTWAKKREVELEHPGALARARQGDVSLGALVKRYREEYGKASKWQRSKEADLKRLERDDLAAVNATGLTAQILIDHVRKRRAGGAGAATALNDLVWIGVVLKAGKTAWGLPVDPGAVDEARDFCRGKKLVGRSRRRERRPTPAELEQLEQHFAGRDRRAEIPMRDLMWFAVHSAKREAEICRLEWADNVEAELTGLVRDAKHPRAKEGNHRRFKYTRAAWEIVQQQPRAGAYIFPYNAKSVGSAFTRACQLLGIEDLRFHDLRHEATSRLFEAGYQIHEVAQFTLHESWNELKRYAQLRPGAIKV